MSTIDPSLAASGEAAAARLDCDKSKSTNDPLESFPTRLIPQRSGGRLHPRDGKADRNRDMARIAHLVDQMRRPHLLTLTVDRELFEGPASAWATMSRRFSQLVTQRLKCKLWFRVLEVQTATGEGWPHIHAVIDLRAMHLKRARKVCWKFWRNKWHIGGVDLVKVKHRRGIAKYLAKYVVKGWPAIPVWILDRTTAPRCVGFSLLANNLLRLVGLREPAGMKRPATAKGRNRKRRPVAERLAASGTTTTVVVQSPDGSFTYLGSLPCPPQSLIPLPDARHLVKPVIDEYGRLVVVGQVPWSKAQHRLMFSALEHCGLAAEANAVREENLSMLYLSWAMMQEGVVLA